MAYSNWQVEFLARGLTLSVLLKVLLIEMNNNFVYFTWSGIGDGLILLGAAYNYFLKYNKKPKIGLSNPEFFEYCNWVEPVENLNTGTYHANTNLWNNLLLESKSVPKFISATGFKYLAPEYNRNVNFWHYNHMITRMSERLGLSGQISISIPLTVKGEKPFSHEYVCVMCGGMQKYKEISPTLMNDVVDWLLSKNVKVVQLGSKRDLKLNGVIDARGGSLGNALLILKHANFFVGGTGGLVHMARSVNCNSLVLQTRGEPVSMSFYVNNKYIYPVDACRICEKNLRDPQHQRCYYEYKCVSGFSLNQVIRNIEESWDELLLRRDWDQKEIAVSDPASGLEDLECTKFTLHNDEAFVKSY